MSTSESASITASEKKRIRDRRAQQNLRDKRLRHIKGLEDRVAYCEQHHASQWLQELLDKVQHLEAENQLLRARHAQIHALTSATDSSPASASLALPAIAGHLVVATASSSSSPPVSALADPAAILTPSTNPLPPGATDTTTILFPNLPPLAAPSLLGPAWSLLPPNDDSDKSLGAASCPWLANRELVAACPPEPDPLDLLHGTRENFLSNAIYRSLRDWLCCDPERLAMGWMIYVWSRWRVLPTPETFALLPEWLRPVVGQLQQTHPSCLDQCVWPQLRINMIRYLEPHQVPETIDLLACCLKVRWRWGEDVLERDARDKLRIRAEFRETFLSEEGWGLTRDFFGCFPLLVQGLDQSKLLYNLA
ncbi:hypothetical protein BDV12DRAFT_179966 [Aspergillus spectabilis]